MGSETGVVNLDESKIIELKNKNWMVNSRVNGKGYRYSHVSSDMGKTWGSQQRNDLIDPGCNESLINYDGDVLLFSKFLIHKSGDNRSLEPRLTFIAHYHNPLKKDFLKDLIVRV